MGNELLEVDNVVAGYEDLDILRGVSLRAEESKITTIIGPNGAGKSTLMKVLFGVLRVRSGRILFEGEDITHFDYISRLRRGIAYSPQGENTFPMMTVEENLEMAAFIRRDREIRKDIRMMYEKYPILGQKKHELAGSLSGGQQHILGMARILLLHPKLILLDEPTAGLSPIFVSEVFKEIRKLNQEGKTVLMVEQNAKHALSISDYAFVLEMGTKKFEGAASEISNNGDVRRLYLGGQ